MVVEYLLQERVKYGKYSLKYSLRTRCIVCGFGNGNNFTSRERDLEEESDPFVHESGR